MQKLQISACYFPTTVVLVDDNSKYLKKLVLMIDTFKAYPRAFDQPQEALRFLKEYKPDPFTKRCLSRPEETHFDYRNIEINVGSIRQEIYNPHRFDEISVVIVDYSMPGLNGVDLCKQLKGAPFKIILLTGEADESQAVRAFNEGVIDKFIRKATSNFEEIINTAINELQQAYFLNLSQIIIDSLTKDPEHPVINWLDEPVFFDLFRQITQENNVSEYYLTDAFGSFMFLDYAGNPSWLAVKSEDEMQAAFEVAVDSDQPFPLALLDAMKKREKLLYMHQKGGLSDNPDEAAKSLHPAKKLIGRKATYYYAYIKDPNAYDIQRDKVFSYQKYREKSSHQKT